MTTVTTAPEAEYWLQTGRMEEPDAELGIRKPVTVDRKTNLHEHRAYWDHLRGASAGTERREHARSTETFTPSEIAFL